MFSKAPNPQGKGGTPVLAALTERHDTLAAAPPKQIQQVSTELFTSMFVLQSEFRFKPVPGKTYYMYHKTGRYWLSMIGPDVFNEDQAGRFIGTCVLHPDMTWTLELGETAANDAAFMAYLEEKRKTFEAHLAEAETVDDILPVYETSLDTFYRRASAFALAYSLGRSMTQSGIQGLSYDEAMGQLAHHNEASDE